MGTVCGRQDKVLGRSGRPFIKRDIKRIVIWKSKEKEHGEEDIFMLHRACIIAFDRL